MKKTALFLFVTAFCAVINAQIISSKSFSVNQENNPVHMGKVWTYYAGAGINTFTGDYDVNLKLGWQTGLEFSKPIGNQGACWGMGVTIGTRGYKVEEDGLQERLTIYNFQWSPFIYGWKINLTDQLIFHPHIGVYMSNDIAGNYRFKIIREEHYKGDKANRSIYETEDYRYFDCGVSCGVGLWFNGKYNIDALFQKGFLPNIDYDNVSGGALNFWIRFGVVL